MNNTTNRAAVPDKIPYLDGLRGFSATKVAFDHLIGLFYFALFTYKASDSHLDGFEISLAESYFTIIYQGVSVPLLFILSGFVLSIGFFKSSDIGRITKSAYRRYFRLTIPVCTSVMLAYLLAKLDLFYIHDAHILIDGPLKDFYTQPLGFWASLKEGLYDCYLINGDVQMNPPLWTMNFELTGSFLVFAILAIFGNSAKRKYVYAILALLIWDTNFYPFIIGMFFCDIQIRGISSKLGNKFVDWYKHNRIAKITALLIAIVLISYLPNRNELYKFLAFGNILSDDEGMTNFYRNTGSAIAYFTIMYSQTLQNLLSGKKMKFIGRISFSLYLIHCLILDSYSCYIYIWLNQFGFNYHVQAIITMLATIPLIFILAYIFTKYIEEPSNRLVKRLIR